MLTVLAHAGQPIGPHDLWAAWNLDPVIVAALVGAAMLHRRGRRPSHPVWRARCFAAGLGVVAVALLSPLDAAARSLASAHMVQHVLLVLVAAPLLAAAAPLATMARGLPAGLRHVETDWRRRTGLSRRRIARLHHPVAAWLAATAVLWIWHAAVLYDAALRHETLHALQHASFLGSAVLLWSCLVGPRVTNRVPPGLGVLVVFAAAMQGVLLAVLVTFATEPWYRGYEATTEAWGLTPLEDQQLAGVLMWVPAGLVHTTAALALFIAFLRDVDQGTERRTRARQPTPRTSTSAP